MIILSTISGIAKAICVRAMYVIWRGLGVFLGTLTIETKQGLFCIRLNGVDHISEVLFVRREFELDWIQSSLAFLRSIGKHPAKGQGVVLDVGANIGVIAIGMLTTGELDSAVAIEPDTDNFALLTRNIELNRLDARIAALNFAAADVTSELEFELSEGNFGDNRVRTTRSDSDNRARELFSESTRRTITVPGARIDELGTRIDKETWNNISLVWIDVQGYEGYAFRGAAEILSRDVPVVMEFWPYGILRTGMTKDEFCGIASTFWGRYWRMEGESFVEFSTNALWALFDAIGDGGQFENIILAK
jgi:FkbM family methyltransferase